MTTPTNDSITVSFRTTAQVSKGMDATTRQEQGYECVLMQVHEQPTKTLGLWEFHPRKIWDIGVSVRSIELDAIIYVIYLFGFWYT